ncbi:M23 family metallopeptidase [Cryobacterium psychrophilum]|uniref:M23 family metallopeptidase n=1 Tax=Cryobacterium psychrophilum TaxID=41988 RepID=A0A4Y8KJN4_9MICO|nr:M23 family metallopeptidase [Cryobacterium psychrophilum]TDW30009.1 murein DD-endopeptidase MepM/ murein hydrolase activator NlpD [Cryobacterium psychrophilum]TFD75543.1 M23 family metallopeptidase [Cryobacterium psychrophilum]
MPTPAPEPGAQPSTAPAPATQPPPTQPPAAQAPAAQPPAIPEGDGIPVFRLSTPTAAAQQTAAARVAARVAAQSARAASAERAAAQRAVARASAQGAVTSALTARDTAARSLASAQATLAALTSRADNLQALADSAATKAAHSRRLLTGLVLELGRQRAGTASVDALLTSGDNLLSALGSIDRLSQLTGSIDAVRERSENDAAHKQSFLDQMITARDAAALVPIAARQADLDAAQIALDAATAALAELDVAAASPARSNTTVIEAWSAPALLSVLDTGQLSTQRWALPTVGGITDVFGPRPTRPLPTVGDFHRGTDIGAACGATVHAATSGVVSSVGPLGTYGNWIVIDHGAGLQTGYAHLATGELLVSVGDSVAAGEVIADVGRTGAATGCHLHVEVRVDGLRVDPQPFLAARGVRLG